MNAEQLVEVVKAGRRLINVFGGNVHVCASKTGPILEVSGQAKRAPSIWMGFPVIHKMRRL